MADRARQPPPRPPRADGPAPAPREPHPVGPAHPPARPAEGAPPPQGAAPHAPPPAPGTPRRAAAPRRAGLPTSELLYLSAALLSTLWAAVLLLVVYPQSPVDAGYAEDDVPVMSLQGNVVTVKRAALEEALASRRYVAASPEQVEYFESRRAETLRAVRRDKLFWFLAAAVSPGLALLLLRAWSRGPASR